MKQIIAVIILAFAGIASAFTQPDFHAMLESIDSQANFNNRDFSSRMTMIREDPETGIEKTVSRQFRRDRNDSFVILIEEPEVKRGQGYLRVSDNLWFYDPESRIFTHSSMK
ncbi:MAG: hypothetical protein EHM28_04165 [Spirochaetaceae bacterium]|nr:MAG: hypothetical protein EHM28_04165 [Spirochaetaceae bacterium]